MCLEIPQAIVYFITYKNQDGYVCFEFSERESRVVYMVSYCLDYRGMFYFVAAIGKGGFGHVWKVKTKKTMEVFALK